MGFSFLFCFFFFSYLLFALLFRIRTKYMDRDWQEGNHTEFYYYIWKRSNWLWPKANGSDCMHIWGIIPGVAFVQSGDTI